MTRLAELALARPAGPVDLAALGITGLRAAKSCGIGWQPR